MITEYKVDSKELISTLTKLKTEQGYSFLSDLTSADYPENYEVLYHLMCMETAELVVIKVNLSKVNPRIHSVTSLWSSANVLEREVYDMFGITFEGHPNLKRILNTDDFTEFPLQKKFVLESIDRQSEVLLMKEKIR